MRGRLTRFLCAVVGVAGLGLVTTACDESIYATWTPFGCNAAIQATSHDYARIDFSAFASSCDYSATDRQICVQLMYASSGARASNILCSVRTTASTLQTPSGSQSCNVGTSYYVRAYVRNYVDYSSGGPYGENGYHTRSFTCQSVALAAVESAVDV